MATKFKSLLSIVMFFVLMFASACKEEPNGPTTQDVITGYFLTEDGTPISSAIVELTDAEGNLLYEGITENDGSFTLESIPQETENSIIAFSKEGRILQLTRLETLIERAQSNSDKRGDIFLDEEYDYNRIWLVKVIDKATKEPIENALVQLGKTSENAIMESYTDSEGITMLKVIYGCFYNVLKIIKNDYIVYSHHTIVIHTNSYTIDIELEPKFAPDGTTNNSVKVSLATIFTGSVENFPLFHRKVNIVGDDGFKDSAYTGGFDDDQNQQYPNFGRVVFTGLKSGIYKISFEAEAGDYERVEQEIQLAGNESKNIYLFSNYKKNLCNNNTLIVNFKDENGNIINCGNATLKAFFFGYYNVLPISSNGSATFTNISKGEHTFFIDVDCEEETDKTYKGVVRDIVFDCNQTNTIDFTLLLDKDYGGECCDISWNIRVVNKAPYHIPIENQKIKVVGPNGYTYSGITTMEGVRLKDLCNGDYTVTWEKDDGTKEIKDIRLKCGNKNLDSYFTEE
ncbi:MAG: carboxypeptidase-like regulatory domain-containing protein [Bacteroidetes bacterium]|nr:carboxypeptidase-like regulatory domain-containing protein [Bacteroidota bacterium]